MARSSTARWVVSSLAAAVVWFIASPPVHASAELDQSATFDGTGNYDSVFVIGATPQRLSQSFTAGVTGTLTSVEVGMSQASSPTNLTIALFDAVSGRPTGSVLTSRTLTGSDLTAVTAGQSMVSVAFATPASVMSGATYAIVASTTNSLPAEFAWYRADPYSRGTAGYEDISGWQTLLFDFAFTTYVIADPVPVQPASESPGSVLQQFAKPAMGTCDEAAAADLNWSGVASGGWSESWASWDGFEGSVCTRTLVYSDALASWIVD